MTTAREVGQAGEYGGKRAISHLDTLIDSIHYPVEEATIDVLSQSISSILSLQGEAKLISVAATEKT